MPKYLATWEVNRTKRQLADLARRVDRDKLAKLLPTHELPLVETLRSQPHGGERQTSKSLAQGDSPLRGKPGYEYELRNVAVAQNTKQMLVQEYQQASVPANLEIRRNRHQRRVDDFAVDRGPAAARPAHSRPKAKSTCKDACSTGRS